MQTLSLDAWTQAAASLRDAALAHEAVAGLSSSRRYQTQGRGQVVTGVRLAQEPTQACAHVGVFLHLQQVDSRSLADISDELRQVLTACWAAHYPAFPLRVDLDVLDLRG